jgi:hypothetical protein
VEPWGGVHYLGSLVPRGLLESSSEPATSRCQYEVTHLVGATRLVDEISQGTCNGAPITKWGIRVVQGLLIRYKGRHAFTREGGDDIEAMH